MKDIKIFGVQHSPWVQGVRVAFFLHGIENTLTAVPPSFSWVYRYGFVMPVVQIDSKIRYIDSFKIYEMLEKEGYDLGMEKIDRKDRLSFQVELESLFLVMHAKGQSRENFGVFSSLSTMQNEKNIFWPNFSRTFLAIYFFLLIRIGIFLSKNKHDTINSCKTFDKKLDFWDLRLSRQNWVSGESCGFLDCALYGQLQTIASGLTDDCISVLKTKKHILQWLECFSKKLQGYEPRYTDRILFDAPEKPQSFGIDAILFWSYFTLFILIFPLH